MNTRSFIKSSKTTWLLAIVFLVVLFVVGRVFVEKYQVDKQIKSLQAQSGQLKRDNEQLSGLIKYFQTPEYSERAAREKLNLKKDGEYVVVLPENNNQSDPAPLTTKQSNPRLWFDYFFSKP